MTALRCTGIRKAYGGVGVLHGVGFTVAAGEILGLCGANGAGKTTLIDIIGGQQPHDAGTIELGGTALTGDAAHRSRAGLARSFQRPQVAADLSLRENIALGLAGASIGSVGRMLRGFVRGIVEGACAGLDQVEAAARHLSLDRLDRRAGDVTFGELRLVELARALVQQPRLIMLDEPFSGVGDSGIAGIIEALRRIRAQGCAVLLIDHNVDLLTALVDRMALLAQGEIVIQGTVETCLADDVFRRTYIGTV